MTKDKINISIFTYRDYRKLLKDLFKHNKIENPAFSNRYFARKAGFKSPVFLKLVIDGKKNLTKDSILKISKGFDFNLDETEFFENLVFMNQTDKLDRKNYYYRKLLQTKGVAKVSKLERGQYDYFSRWYHCAIRELILFENGRLSTEQMGEKLSPSIPAKYVRSSLKLLQELGLIEKDKKGKWKQTDKNVTTGEEVFSIMLAEFHKRMIDLAKRSVESFKAEEREISSLTATVNKKDLPIIKEKIRLLQKDLINFINSNDNGDTVYQINFQVFPLTNDVTFKKAKYIKEGEK